MLQRRSRPRQRDDEELGGGQEHRGAQRDRAHRPSSEDRRQRDDPEPDGRRQRHGRGIHADEQLSQRFRRRPDRERGKGAGRAGQQHRRHAERRGAAEFGVAMERDPQQLDRQQRPDDPQRDHQQRRRRIGHQRRQCEDREQPGERAGQPGGGDGEASSRDETEAGREEERRHGVADWSSGWVGVGRIPNVLNGQ